MTTAYPLQWPQGWPKTPEAQRSHSQFKVTPDRATNNLRDQLRMLGATEVIISTNVAIRQDGQPYADAARRIIRDPGVAVYFKLDGADVVMARDIYERPHENIHAIGHAVEAMRSLERHGGSHMMKQAFTGFAALPAPSAENRLPWWTVLELDRGASLESCESMYRLLAAQKHPDKPGGSEEAMAELNAARDAMRKEKATQ